MSRWLAASGTRDQSVQEPLIPPHALNVNVVLFGHSWIDDMRGFQPWAFPNIPSSHIVIEGYPGYVCAGLLEILSANVPPSTDAVFLMTATNDVILNVPVSEHMACMNRMIGQLIAENPRMLILASNVPPLGHAYDRRSLIAAYNQA